MYTRPGYKSFASPYHSILIIHCDGVSDFRVNFAARYLERAGYDVDIIGNVPYCKAAQYDLFICSRPSGPMVEFLNICLDADKRVIIDMDDDFLSIPKSNPAWGMIGPGNLNYQKDLVKIMAESLVVYAMPELINRYHVDGIVIPNSWDNENTAWDQPKSQSTHFRLGWTGTNTHLEDFKIIEPAIRQVLAERNNVKIVIGNDATIFNRFFDIPKEQKKYVPPLRYEDYPLSLSVMDLLLVPLIDNTFNRAKSDIKMLDAGATLTPYIASPLPMYTDWNENGVIAENNTESWYKAIVNAIDNPMVITERSSRINMRNAENIGMRWVDLVGHVFHG